MTAFITSGDAVYWLSPRPVRLTPASVERLLDIFDREGAIEPFNELFQARAALAVAPLGIIDLQPITAQVRPLDPRVWGLALADA